MKIDKEKLLDAQYSQDCHCGGFRHCEDSFFDISKKDCQECLKDVDEALEKISKEMLIL